MNKDVVFLDNELELNKSLTSKSRDDLDDTDFALPSSRRYPIPDEAHARNALARVSQYGTDDEKAIVRKAVKKKFPGVDAGTTTNTVVSHQFEYLTWNADTARVRHELLEGRNYTVVPMVMLTEGVHEGSNGPLYYPAAELSKTPAVWNHKPIVVYHPTSNGEPISACEPAVISKRKVGLIMNAKYVSGRRGQPGKLKAEAWLETNRLKTVDDRVAAAVQNKQMMEISTGLFTDNEQVDGRWGKEDYTAIARNYRPDHLAILPDEVGACSIKDGGGLMRNSSMSHSEIRDQLNTAVRKSRTLPSTLKGSEDTPWIRDVYDTFAIYTHGGKTFQQKYDVDENNGIKLKGTPSEVTSKQVYMTTDGKVINTQGASMPTVNEENAPKVIEWLTTNAGSPFDDADREYLEGLDGPKLAALAINAGIKKSAAGDTIDDGGDDNGETLEDAAAQVKAKKLGSRSGATKNKKKPDDADPDEAEADAGMAKGKKGKGNMDGGACNAEPTMNEYIANAPAAMRDVLINGVRAHNATKAKLIATIVANKANIFTKEQLAVKGLQELQGMAALAASAVVTAPAGGGRVIRTGVTANYGGLGDASFDQPPVDNTAEEEEALEMPVLNFSKRGKGVTVEEDDE